ncbi:MAG: exodeoxyribonuclease VII small subunit [Eubacterium sp.]|jgi:Exonuclease VII small subunit.|nr:exodeoxyribonuclease VII small subunit [Eubacterium sp.]
MDDATVFNIEEGMKRLSEINAALNDSSIKLTDAMKLYEEGINLAKQCKASLEDTKKTLQEIDPTLIQQ